MPTYKDPAANREYMRRYMQAVRFRRKLEKLARINQNKTAFLLRERELRWRKEAQNILNG